MLQTYCYNNIINTANPLLTKNLSSHEKRALHVIQASAAHVALKSLISLPRPVTVSAKNWLTISQRIST